MAGRELPASGAPQSLARRGRVSLARAASYLERWFGLRRVATIADGNWLHELGHPRQRALEPSPGAGRRRGARGRGWRRTSRHLPDEQPGLERPVPQPGRLALRGNNELDGRRGPLT